MTVVEKHGHGACLVCDCEGTMTLDGAKLADALGLPAPLRVHSHLCRTEIAAFQSALGKGDVFVACTQEAPLFSEVAEDEGYDGDLTFANIRETAGWTATGDATPKAAALIAAALTPMRPTAQKTLQSEGVCLVYGAGQAAMDVAEKLSGRLSVSLILSDPGDMIPSGDGDIPIARGRVSSVTGHLGAFAVTVDGYAPLSPSSRATAEFIMPRDGAASECDIVFDMSGGAPLVTGPDKRDGYLRVDPASPVALAEAMLAAGDLVGAFEKPVYVNYDPALCAHSRNGQVGCSKCLDTCPAGAIAPDGDHVAYDHGICGGCGGCAAVCPSGAVGHAFPYAADRIVLTQTLLSTYLGAGGTDPVILFHDDGHGAPLISAMARHGRGLPVNVLPVAVHSVTALGHEVLLSAFAAGAARIAVLVPPQRTGEMDALDAETALASAILDGLGLDGARFDLTDASDPDAVEALLHGLPKTAPIAPARFDPVGGRREIARAAIGRLRTVAPGAADIVPLPDGAPYGRIAIATDGCTLCLSCVSVCPTDALKDMTDRPGVRMVEAACLQCGLCRTTCPERVITLEPRLNLTPNAMEPVTIHEEEPFLCVECGKPFGTCSTIERIVKQLAGTHSMFRREGSERVIQMCDDCRIIWQANQADNPFAAGDRPRVRTTEDYLAAREGKLTSDDFLDGD
ncbi:MAG: 4Fe-4S binding protein [Rhodobiaceae bacterium]|nr:4Fe-4S binding protein [Rhodobiaceae bacterium]